MFSDLLTTVVERVAQQQTIRPFKGKQGGRGEERRKHTEGVLGHSPPAVEAQR